MWEGAFFLAVAYVLLAIRKNVSSGIRYAVALICFGGASVAFLLTLVLLLLSSGAADQGTAVPSQATQTVLLALCLRDLCDAF